MTPSSATALASTPQGQGTHLHKPNIRRLLPELLPAQVQAVLVDDAALLAGLATVPSLISPRGPQGRTQLGLPFAGLVALAVGSGAGVPDCVMRHS